MYAVGYNEDKRISVAEVEVKNTAFLGEDEMHLIAFVAHVAGEPWSYREENSPSWINTQSVFETREAALTAAAQEGIDEAKVMTDQAREFLDLKAALYPAPPVKTKRPRTRYQRSPKL